MTYMARERPDPKSVSPWLNACLGERPYEIKCHLLAGFKAEIKARHSGSAETRAATMLLKMVEKVRGTLR